MRRAKGRTAMRPAWAELAVADSATASGFYESLLSWSFTEATWETEGYLTAFAEDQPVAGLAQRASDVQEAYWTVFLGVADVPQAVRTAESLGATVLSPPMQVMEFGRLAVPGDQRAADPWMFPGSDREMATMAVLADPDDTLVGLWAWYGRDRGRPVRTPGSLPRAVHLSADPVAARRFYRDLVGAAPDPDAPTTASGGTLGQAAAVDFDQAPPGLADLAPLWLPCFAVPDVDAALSLVARLGGTGIGRAAPDDNTGASAWAAGPGREIFGLVQADTVAG